MRRTSSHRWLIAANCYLALTGFALGVTVFGPLVSVLEGFFQTNEAVIGTLYAVYSIGFMISVLSGGFIVERVGLGRMMLIGPGGWAVGLAFFGFANSLPIAMVAMLLTGLSGGFSQVGINATISTVFQHDRPFAMNLLHVFYGLGAIMGPRLTAVIIERQGGWQTVYWLVSAVSVLAFLFALWLRYPVLETTPDSDNSPLLEISSFSRSLWFLALMMACYVGTEMCINNWGPLYMEKVIQIPKGQAAANLSNFWLFMVIGRILCALLARKISADRLLIVLLSGSLLSTLAFVALPFEEIVHLNLIGAGIFMSGFFATLMAYAGDLFPKSVGRVTGIMIFAASVGNLLFPWIAGLIGSVWGVRLSMALEPLLVGCMVVLYVLIRIEHTKTGG